MNKMKKIIAIGMAALMVISAFAGCKKDTPADQYVLAMYKFIVNGDSKDAKAIGVSDTVIADFQRQKDQAVKTGTATINDSFQQQCGTSVDDQLISDYYKAYFNALAKLNATVKIESSTDKEAKVTLTSNYLDMATMTAQAMENAQAAVKAADYSADKDYKKDVLTEYVKELTKLVNDFIPSKETQSTTVTCVKNNNTWSCSDETTFAQAITGIAVKEQAAQ